MVKIVDTVDNTSFSSDNPYALISHNGSFFLSACKQSISAWDGLYFLDASDTTAHKVVHAITHSQEIKQLHVGLDLIRREATSLLETMYFYDTAFVYRAHAKDTVTITLECDVRSADDYSTDNRFHTIETLQDGVYKLIGNDESYIIASTQPIKITDSWIPVHTSYDQRRGGSDQWWVHQRIQLQIGSQDSCTIAVAKTVQQAVSALSSSTPSDSSKTYQDTVLQRAIHALNQLTVDTSVGIGILAGYPWFTQVWTRDEAISLGAHIHLGNYEIAKEILLRQVQRIDEHGRISNRTPGSELGSADGVGWVFTRLHELYEQSPDSLSDTEWRYCYDQLCLSLDRLYESHLNNNLIVNAPKETWMDTNGSTDDVREGACIEIQALTLRSLQLAVDLAKRFKQNPDWWKKKLSILHNSVRAEFFQSDRLYDRAGDPTQRPNAFIAAYVYPQLLSHTEWRRVFLSLLDSLWLDWGALATIDTTHYLFKEYHTGMQDDSYHRGDSWYWVNLMAAKVLYQHSSEFHEFSQKLFSSACTDLRKLGVIGHPSEISNAAVQQAFGCWSQAWSAAMLIECSLLIQ